MFFFKMFFSYLFALFFLATNHVLTITTLQLNQLPVTNFTGPAGCTCTNITRIGEYCGSELNRANKNTACTRDQYLCGRSNWNRQAVIILFCLPGLECDTPLGAVSNACTANIDCNCPSTLIRDGRTTYCGSQLVGRNCEPNVVFTCTPSMALPVDGCLNGCRDGRCL